MSILIPRCEFVIQDADAKLLIADKSLLERVPNYKGKVLLLEDIPSLSELCKNDLISTYLTRTICQCFVSII